MPTHLDLRDSQGRDLLGVILAGGESRRFGREKALFPLAGLPMAAWVLDALRQCTADQVVITPDSDLAETLEVRGRPDRLPGAGPLGGLHAALSWAREEGREGVFLMACDLPLVTGGLMGRIVENWPGGAPMAVPGSPGPLGFEPLCACYGTSVLQTVEELLEAGRRSMDSVVERLGIEPIPPEMLGATEVLAVAFTNVNTEDAAEQAELLISKEGRSSPGSVAEGSKRARSGALWEAWG